MTNWANLRRYWEPRWLSILRIVVGFLYLQHGLNKFFNFPPTPNHRPYDLFTLEPGLAGILETVGSIFIILGLFTRPVAFILSGEMAVAYFLVNVHRSFFPLLSAGDMVVLYCFVYFYLFLAGGGAWSTDQLRAKRFSRRNTVRAGTD